MFCFRCCNCRYYVFELCDVSLYELFESDHKKYNGPTLRVIEVFLQLASGLERIHSEDFVHRDISPHNILIAVRHTDQNAEVKIKLAGSRLSTRLDEWKSFRTDMTEFGGTNWLAPELLELYLKCEKSVIEDEAWWECDVNIDVFALALVFGYMLLGGEHLYGSEEKEIFNMIMESRPINMLSNSNILK